MHEEQSTGISRRAALGGAAALGALALTQFDAASASAASSATTARGHGAVNAKPVTIPALQEWTGRRGRFELSRTTEILIRPRDAWQFRDIAALLAADIGTTTGQPVRVNVSDRRPRRGDITLRLGTVGAELGSEGYQLDIDDVLTVTAATSTGAFYGGQTILQLLRQGRTVVAGTARDWPVYRERGLLVDVARMYFSLSWLKARVRDMASIKLNVLSLHLTDDEGWGVESKLGVQSTNHLTKRELSELVSYAAARRVTVIPEIDSPAHLGALLQKYPQYRLVDVNGAIASTKLDFTIPGAIELIKSILEEYLPLFPGSYWHLGQDEYLANSLFANYPQLERWAKERVGASATAKDSVIAFANDLNSFVRSRGKRARMWNDSLGPGTTITADANIVVQWWTDADPENLFGDTGPYAPQTLIDQGHEVLNDSLLPTYAYPTGGQTPQINPAWMYESWSAEQFYGYLYREDGNGGYQKYLPTKTLSVGNPKQTGASLNDWNSGGTWTPEEAATDLYPRLRIMAQKTWNSPEQAATYSDFQALITKAGSPNQ